MSYIRYEQLVITATSSGPTITLSANAYNGLVRGINYVASTSAPYSTANNIAVVGERSAITILSIDGTTASKAFFPYSSGVTSTGVALSGPVPYPVFNERLQITISSGSTDGTTKSGTFGIYVE